MIKKLGYKAVGGKVAGSVDDFEMKPIFQ